MKWELDTLGENKCEIQRQMRRVCRIEKSL